MPLRILLVMLAVLMFSHVYAQNTVATKKTKLFSATLSLPAAKAATGTGPAGDTLLLAAIVNGVRSGRITAYADSAFTTQLSIQAFNSVVNDTEAADTFSFYNPEKDQEVLMIIRRDVRFFDVNNFKILAKGSPSLPGIELVGVAPSRIGDTSGISRGNYCVPGKTVYEYFWLRYDEVRSIIEEYDRRTANKFANQLKKLKVPATDVIVYDNGDQYEGYVTNGKPNGKGTYFFAHTNYALGDFYTGLWVNGNPPTQVTYHTEQGNVYTGGFKNGKFNGKGTKTWLRGDKYTGDWKDSRFQGEGVYTWRSGNKYTGHFDSGYFSGKGTKYYGDGDKYTGYWKEDKEWGEGTYTYADGDKYTGQWENGLRDGRGTFTWANGEKYTGQFHENERTGEGTYYWPNGDKYSGHFEKGEISGQGTRYFKNGDKQEGTWKDSEMDGYGTFELADKVNFEVNDCPDCVIYKGYWKNGLKSGTGSCYDKNRTLIYEGPFADDKPTGNYPGRGKQ